MGWSDGHGVKDWTLDKVPELTALDQALPARALDWLPDWRSMAPTLREALKWQDGAWGKYLQKLFFSGGGALPTRIKEGVKDADAMKARTIVRAAMASYAPSHEHKIAACAWILARYFEFPEGART